MKRNKYGFTLAEMLVVLFVISLILAATLPVLTVRLKSASGSTSSIWKWSDDKTNIYFGRENTPGAAIGTNSITTTDNARLLLNTASSVTNQNHILFKEDDAVKGKIKISTDGSILFSGDNGNSAENSAGIVIGEGNLASQSVKIGHRYSYTDNIGTGAVSVGYDAIATSTSSTSLGYTARASQYGATALGSYSEASGWSSTALGYSATAKNSYITAVGYNTCQSVSGQNKTCLGKNAGPYGMSPFASVSDNAERIFIGSYPAGSSTNGDAVLEVHNTTSGTSVSSINISSTSAPVVVINGHLVVRGFTYIRTGAGEGLRRIVGDSSELRGDYATPTGWTWPNMSDEKLKNVTGENKDGLDKIRQLKTYDYTYKNDILKENHVGIMAQDLQKVFPNAVRKEDDGYLRIRYTDMFYAIINAIKELDSAIKELSQKVETLLVEINTIREQNVEIINRLERLEKIETSKN